mmetsp:Transcript_39540/g.85370  ORF Transcript_39540/g.85370 Transcript_39540/m.85370 type:complete len:205 (+) Transcript_39540:476-1090(+)
MHPNLLPQGTKAPTCPSHDCQGYCLDPEARRCHEGVVTVAAGGLHPGVRTFQAFTVSHPNPLGLPFTQFDGAAAVGRRSAAVGHGRRGGGRGHAAFAVAGLLLLDFHPLGGGLLRQNHSQHDQSETEVGLCLGVLLKVDRDDNRAHHGVGSILNHRDQAGRRAGSPRKGNGAQQTSDSTHHTTDDQQRKSRRPLRVVPGAMPTL